jgi:hypothetical protein
LAEAKYNGDGLSPNPVQADAGPEYATMEPEKYGYGLRECNKP